MLETNVTLPSKPRVVSEEEFQGVYEIDGLFPGYGHTLGNSLRRIILASLPGATITQVKIEGVAHEFATIAGVQSEDVITILLNLKRVRFMLHGEGPIKVTLKKSGVGPGHRCGHDAYQLRLKSSVQNRLSLKLPPEGYNARYGNHYRTRSRLRSARSTPEGQS
jgi:DNA-directed RNA polymerase alpha subunit